MVFSVFYLGFVLGVTATHVRGLSLKRWTHVVVKLTHVTFSVCLQHVQILPDAYGVWRARWRETPPEPTGLSEGKGRVSGVVKGGGHLDTESKLSRRILGGLRCGVQAYDFSLETALIIILMAEGNASGLNRHLRCRPCIMWTRCRDRVTGFVCGSSNKRYRKTLTSPTS